MNQEKINLILNEIYRRIYKVSNPPADWDQLLENATVNKFGQKEIPFMDYECEEEVMKNTIKSVLKEHRVPKWMHQMFESTIWLGCSPKTKK